jgi:hypothetical protein
MLLSRLPALALTVYIEDLGLSVSKHLLACSSRPGILQSRTTRMKRLIEEEKQGMSDEDEDDEEEA